jgi:hypothetical protein
VFCDVVRGDLRSKERRKNAVEIAIFCVCFCVYTWVQVCGCVRMCAPILPVEILKHSTDRYETERQYNLTWRAGEIVRCQPRDKLLPVGSMIC